jgi:hypothetical protein
MKVMSSETKFKWLFDPKLIRDKYVQDNEESDNERNDKVLDLKHLKSNGNPWEDDQSINT